MSEQAQATTRPNITIHRDIEQGDVKLCGCGCGKPAPISTTTDKTRGYVKGQPMRFRRGHRKTVRRNDVTPSDEKRFAKFVPAVGPDECWEWQSTRNQRGYGKFWLNGRTDLAHRVSYRIHKGEIPQGLIIRHSCDNPPCVNPGHLSTGTIRDNAQDAIARDRLRRGEDNPIAKLTEEQVLEIREAYGTTGETQLAIALRYGVSRSAIHWIVSGQHWKHVGGVA